MNFFIGFMMCCPKTVSLCIYIIVKFEIIHDSFLEVLGVTLAKVVVGPRTYLYKKSHENQYGTPAVFICELHTKPLYY